ncbi:MAG TPA: hypothetical protein VM008_20680 [Phycisphaerae bacterium]|nr:hypothetical protein [Phycisphaerae bacterium]
MADKYEAADVLVEVDGTGRIKKVTDGDGKSKDLDDDCFPVHGAMYGWDLEPYLKKGVDIGGLFASDVHVSTNDSSDTKDQHTLALVAPRLVKLDVGHWGGYKRWREFPPGSSTGSIVATAIAAAVDPEPISKGAAVASAVKQGIKKWEGDSGTGAGKQRDFGLIENGHVWLCLYVADGTDSVYQETKQKLKDAGAPLAGALNDAVYNDRKAAIKLVSHAVAVYNVADFPQNKLFAIFPDLHLPERWPDLPLPTERYHGAKRAEVILKMQLLLREAQRHFVPIVPWGSPIDDEDQAALQTYLERMHNTSDADKNDAHQKLMNGAPIDSIARGLLYCVELGVGPFSTKYWLSPIMVQAEKDIVDRELRLRSTWFYARGPNWDEEAGAGEEDWLGAILRNGNGDASPAVDLVNLLCALQSVRDNPPSTAKGGSVAVIQVGDIYEAWVNREFLYRFFPTNDKKAAPSDKLWKIKLGATRQTWDNYQYRKDKWHYSSDSRAPDLKLYVCKDNEWPTDELIWRHFTGNQLIAKYGTNDDAIADGVTADGTKFTAAHLTRLRLLLKERIDNVEDFRLHAPTVPGGTKLTNGFQALQSNNQDLLDEYTVQNKFGHTEYCWNEMILDLVYGLAGNYLIHGNHDGYRGDKLLNAESGRAACAAWISEPGMWVEHSHRWDPFNRDGCAFGAGAANLTYYYFNNLCSKFAGLIEGMVGNQELENFIPGAALWFLLVNCGQDKDWFYPIRKNIKPFGIYVNGHTHSASLVNLKFKLGDK